MERVSARPSRLQRVLAWLVVALALTNASVILLSHGSSHFDAPRGFTFIGIDVPDERPYAKSELVQLLVEDTTHFNPLSHNRDDVWHSTRGLSRGFVRFSSTASTSNSSSRPRKTDRRFILTMFHEIHCMRVLSDIIAGASELNLHHLGHCADYLRSGILCGADLTLEPWDEELIWFNGEQNPQPHSGRRKKSARHVCRDWSAVYDAVDGLFTEPGGWNETRAKLVVEGLT